MLRPVVVMLALALGLAACVTSSAGPGGDAATLCTNALPALPFVPAMDGPGPETFCDGVRASLCGQFQRCGCITSDDAALATCDATVAAKCDAAFVGPDVVSALARGTLVWDRARAADFLARLATAAQSDDPIVLDGATVALGTLAVGAPCTVLAGAFTECVDGASCLAADGGTRCAWDPALSPFQDEGGACVPASGPSVPGACGASRGLRCLARCDGASSPGVCEPALPAGATCADGADCASGICRSGACAALLADRAVCAADTDCQSAYCERGKCAAPPPPPLPPGAYVGEACASETDCATRSCVGGICAIQACTARLDRANGAVRAVFTARP